MCVRLTLGHKRTKEKYHDEFYNAQGAKVQGGQPKYPPALMPRDKKLRDWKRREAERMEKECPQVDFVTFQYLS